MNLPLSQELLGTIPGWITAGGTVTLLGLFLRYGVAWRGQSMNAEEQIRDHYSKEVNALRAQLTAMEKHYRDMLKDSDKRHEECQLDRDKLRDRVRGLEQHVEGLERKIAQLSTDALIQLRPDQNAPHAIASAPRAKEARENGDK